LDYDHRPFFGRHVGEPHHLPCLQALVQDRLVDDHDDIALAPVLVLGELSDRHLQHREGGVRTVSTPNLQARNLGRT